MGTNIDLSFFDAFAPVAPADTGSSGASSAFSLDGAEIAATAGKTTDKGYRALVKNINTTSYSILERLHACPRAFALDKLKAVRELAAGVPEAKNIDFVYGHAVGAGVQALFATNNNLDAGIFATFLSWKADLDFGSGEYQIKKQKQFWQAVLAVEKFHVLLGSHPVLSNYEIYTLPDGRPAVELSFKLDTEDGYSYYGHIDVIVRSKITGKIAVCELKTTGYTSIHPALFANSNQALGYAVALDVIVPGQTEYDVIYCVYSARGREWEVLEFHKNFKKKAEWAQALLLDHQQIGVYRQLNFYPTRGSSCMNYNRPCEWFGECHLVRKAELAKLPELPHDASAEAVDYAFTLSDVIAQQQENMK